MALHMVTDSSNPDFDVLVEMTPEQATRVEDGGFTVVEIDPKAAVSFEEFKIDFLDD